MKKKQEQMYLGDIISADGTHAKNIQHRKNKGKGSINQIMQILDSVYFGKYYFEVAIVLRSSLLLSSLLLNSEAWVNINDKEIRSLEQTDEILLSKLTGSEANTSNAFKYLELGIMPLRFEIMKRKILYLQYILKQEKTSMIYKVFEATVENPVKNDFVQTCERYLSTLNLNLTFSEIEQMGNWKFKKMVKEKVKLAAFNYLIAQQKKQTKILDIQYKTLEMQEYLLEGNKSIEVSKFIFKARSKTLDIKMQRKWKYEDKLCTGCKVREETGEEILTCTYFEETDEENAKPMTYDMFYCGSISDMILVAKCWFCFVHKSKVTVFSFDNPLFYCYI